MISASTFWSLFRVHFPVHGVLYTHSSGTSCVVGRVAETVFSYTHMVHMENMHEKRENWGCWKSMEQKSWSHVDTISFVRTAVFFGQLYRIGNLVDLRVAVRLML